MVDEESEVGAESVEELRVGKAKLAVANAPTANLRKPLRVGVIISAARDEMLESVDKHAPIAA